MTWMNLDRAILDTKTSQATWYRRISDGHPSRTVNGTRQVWVEGQPDILALIATVEKLQGSVTRLIDGLQFKSDEEETQDSIEATRTYESEADFTENFVVPLLNEIGCEYILEAPCEIYAGSTTHKCKVDVLVTSTHRAMAENEGLTEEEIEKLFPNVVIEVKRRLSTDREKRIAAQQARSYALETGSCGFILMSPEGAWSYDICNATNKVLPDVGHCSTSDAEDFKYWIKEEIQDLSMRCLES